MERDAAMKKLRRLLGPNVGFQINSSAPTEEQRQNAKQAMDGLHKAKAAASKAREERMQFVLANDAEYQRLKEIEKQARDASKKNTDILLTHKITVGVSSKMFFHVKAQASCWEDIITIVERNLKRAS